MATITLNDAVFRRLEKVSGARRNPEIIVRQAIKEKLEYEEWKLRQIEAGMKEISDGRGIPDSELREMMGVPPRARKAA